MLAQTDGVDVEEVTKTLPIEVDFVEKGGSDGPSGYSADHSSPDSDAGEAAAQTANTETDQSEDKATGFTMDEAVSKSTANEESPTTYAAAVKAPAADDDASRAGQAQDRSGENLSEPSAAVDDAEDGMLADPQPESKDAVPSPAENPPDASSADPPANPVMESPSIPAPVAEAADTVPESNAAELDQSPGQSSTSASPSENPDLLSVASPSSSSTAVPFPGMPRMNTSQSAQSELSELDAADSTSDLPDVPSAEGKDKETRRNRLSSLKGFVRRISDQGVTRSPSTNRPGSSGKSPMAEVDEATALLSSQTATPSGEGEKKKKRLSIKKT